MIIHEKYKSKGIPSRYRKGICGRDVDVLRGQRINTFYEFSRRLGEICVESKAIVKGMKGGREGGLSVVQ